MYFDKIGSQKHGGQVSRTRVDLIDGSYIEPDAIFGFRYREQDFLYVLEYHIMQDKRQIEKQLIIHKESLDSGEIPRKYGMVTTQFVLSLQLKKCKKYG